MIDIYSSSIQFLIWEKYTWNDDNIWLIFIARRFNAASLILRNMLGFPFFDLLIFFICSNRFLWFLWKLSHLFQNVFLAICSLLPCKTEFAACSRVPPCHFSTLSLGGSFWEGRTSAYLGAWHHPPTREEVARFLVVDPLSRGSRSGWRVRTTCKHASGTRTLRRVKQVGVLLLLLFACAQWARIAWQDL